MLVLRDKAHDSRGYYRQGTYSLVIARREQGEIIADPPVEEFIFTPNPTDIDDMMQFPNVVQADQGTGFYVDLNPMGVKTISIRGTTGQFPKEDIVERVLGAQGSAISSTARGIVPQVDNYGDGYNIWVALASFFVKWGSYVQNRPHGYAMLFLNSKDAEIFHVVPMSFRKTRTSARPLSYGFSIDLQVIGEQQASFRRDWFEWMNDTRSRIQNWQNAIDNVLLLASELYQDIAIGTVGTVFAPITDTLEAMTAGLQGFVQTSEHIRRNSAYSLERLTEVAEQLALADTYSAGYNAPLKRITDQAPIASGSGRPMMFYVPPTPVNVADALQNRTEDIAWYTVELFPTDPASGGEISNLPLDDAGFENYGNALRMMMETYRAIDFAPLPSQSPNAQAGAESRDIHHVARSGGAGMIDGRQNELASAGLAGETTVVTDPISGVETRHAVRRQQTRETMTLSHMASKIVHAWATTHDERISPSIGAFRQWYLGMRDPNTFSPLYKNYTVGLTDTIYSIATTVLGSWRRWAEIALVNGLKYPYISRTGGPYQAKPGDQIQIPLEDSTMPVEVVDNILRITEVHDLVTQQDAFIGFDVEVNERTGDMTYSVFDVGHVSGAQAYNQEMSIVLEGSGGVTPDRVQGPLIRIGTKGKGRATLDFWRGILHQWLLQDDRVAQVEYVNVNLRGDAVYYTSKLRFENYDSAVTLAGYLRT